MASPNHAFPTASGFNFPCLIPGHTGPHGLQGPQGMNPNYCNEIPTCLLPGAILPLRGTPNSAGLDLYALEDRLITRTQQIVPTGVSMAIPPGFVGQVWSRSSMAAKNGVFREAGIIDSDYRGQIGVVLYSNEGTYQVRKGDKIAQLVIVPCNMSSTVQVDSLDSTVRGQGGYGSTGK